MSKPQAAGDAPPEQAPMTDDVAALQRYLGAQASGEYFDGQRRQLADQALQRWPLLQRLRDELVPPEVP